MLNKSEQATADRAWLKDFFAKGGSLQLLADLPDEELTRLEIYAGQLFQTSEYSAARNIYMLLSTIDHWNIEYQLNLGLCHQRLGAHFEALECFARVGTRRLDDPRAAFFSGLSFRLLGNEEHAKKAFNAAVLCSGHQEQFRKIKESAQQMLNA